MIEGMFKKILTKGSRCEGKETLLQCYYKRRLIGKDALLAKGKNPSKLNTDEYLRSLNLTIFPSVYSLLGKSLQLSFRTGQSNNF